MYATYCNFACFTKFYMLYLICVKFVAHVSVANLGKFCEIVQVHSAKVDHNLIKQKIMLKHS